MKKVMITQCPVLDPTVTLHTVILFKKNILGRFHIVRIVLHVSGPFHSVRLSVIRDGE